MFFALTFGGGSKRYNAASERFKSQLEELEVFDEIFAFTELNLKKREDFWEKNGNFIENNKRGYGYWIWKPYIIMEQLKCMSEGDILFYADAGCEVDFSKKDKFIQLKNYLMKEDCIPILADKQPGYKEEFYCKMDTFIGMDCCDLDIMKTPQYRGGVLGIKNCKEAREFINQWYYYCMHYHLLDDTPSELDNAKKFKEHRHDQSIFSVLYKKTFNHANSDISVGDCVFILRTRDGGSKLNRIYRKC